LALPLHEAGLNRVNVSLDAIDDEVAAIMAGQRVDTDQVWANILQARETGLGVKVNCVLKRGVNEHQAIPLAERCREHGVTLRFIDVAGNTVSPCGSSNIWMWVKPINGSPLRLLQDKRSWTSFPHAGH
jgi:molybdenum cofactor biosynthesis enzyme MoaA